MKFGLRYCNTGRYIDTALATELVQAGEAAGFDSAWTVEHTVMPRDYVSMYPYSADGRLAGGQHDIPLPDPLIWMACMAGVTSTIKLATGILLIPQHNPVLAAKQIATLDFMSGGRVLLGVGVGWLKEEFDAIGVPFADRGRRTDEYIGAMRELWSAEQPRFAGEFVNFNDVHCRPQPVNGSVPIIIGGHSKAAARRAGRLGDGFFPARGAPAELIDLVRRSADAAGRDGDAIEITTSLPDDLNDLPAMAKDGVHRVLVPVTGMAGLAPVIDGPESALHWRDTIERYADL
ncbi:MAG: putative F420-dependent oxidoreductase [Gammaproteobacteria bacterium]|jgi:probable F420-dependent oxidoreductase